MDADAPIHDAAGDARLADLVAACAIIDGESLTTAFGHLSARDRDAVLVSASEGPGLVRTADDFVRVTLDGDVVSGDAARLPGEAAIHLGVYRAREDVLAVCRFHGPALLAWGTLSRPLPAATGMGLFCGALVPVFDTSSTIRDAPRADALAAALGDGVAVILRGFGAVTVGSSVPEAVARAWLLERNAAAVLAASSAGTPVAYTRADAAALTRSDGPAASQIARVFHYLRARHTTTDGPPTAPRGRPT